MSFCFQENKLQTSAPHMSAAMLFWLAHICCIHSLCHQNCAQARSAEFTYTPSWCVSVIPQQSCQNIIAFADPYLHVGACHVHLQGVAHLLQGTDRDAGHPHVGVQVVVGLGHLFPRCVRELIYMVLPESTSVVTATPASSCHTCIGFSSVAARLLLLLCLWQQFRALFTEVVLHLSLACLLLCRAALLLQHQRRGLCVAAVAAPAAVAAAAIVVLALQAEASLLALADPNLHQL